MSDKEIGDFFRSNPSILGIIVNDKLYIKNATSLGFLEAKIYDGVDLSYMQFNTRRGRVQEGMSQTITCQSNLGVVVDGNKE